MFTHSAELNFSKRWQTQKVLGKSFTIPVDTHICHEKYIGDKNPQQIYSTAGLANQTKLLRGIVRSETTNAYKHTPKKKSPDFTPVTPNMNPQRFASIIYLFNFLLICPLYLSHPASPSLIPSYSPSAPAPQHETSSDYRRFIKCQGFNPSYRPRTCKFRSNTYS